MVAIKADYRPDPARVSEYREVTTEFINLYKETKAIHKRLNRRRLGAHSAGT